MGSCFSCSSSSESSSTIRVVHLNGYVEDFEFPVTVRQVTGKPAKHFVCTPAQLLSTGSKPLNPNTQLEQGRVYLLLPFSVLKPDVSPLDLVSVARKLTAIAKTNRSYFNLNQRSFLSGQNGSSSIWASPARSPNRFSPQASPVKLETCEEQKSYQDRSWKPILDTIRERSFNRRSESDLQAQNATEELRLDWFGGMMFSWKRRTISSLWSPFVVI